MTMEIRAATKTDYDAIRAVNLAAFGSSKEAGLIENLRADGDVVLEYVAVQQKRIVGHILYSRVKMENGTPAGVTAAAIGPVAVLPETQGSGIGSKLIRTSLDACQAGGIEAELITRDLVFPPRLRSL